MRNKISRLTKITGLIHIIFFSLLFLLIFGFFILFSLKLLGWITFPLDNGEQSYIDGLFTTISYMLLFSVIIVSSFISGLYLLINIIFYKKCLKGEISIGFMSILIALAIVTLLNYIIALIISYNSMIFVLISLILFYMVYPISAIKDSFKINHSLYHS